jgi:hypothetical protein
MSGCIEKNGALRKTFLADNHLLGCDTMACITRDTIACVCAHCLYVCFSFCLSVLLPIVVFPAPCRARILRSSASETDTMWRPGHSRRRLSAPTSMAPIVASQKSLDSIVKLDTLRKEDAGFGYCVFHYPYVHIRTHAVRMRA